MTLNKIPTPQEFDAGNFPNITAEDTRPPQDEYDRNEVEIHKLKWVQTIRNTPATSYTLNDVKVFDIYFYYSVGDDNLKNLYNSFKQELALKGWDVNIQEDFPNHFKLCIRFPIMSSLASSTHVKTSEEEIPFMEEVMNNAVASVDFSTKIKQLEEKNEKLLDEIMIAVIVLTMMQAKSGAKEIEIPSEYAHCEHSESLSQYLSGWSTKYVEETKPFSFDDKLFFVRQS